MRRWAIAAPAAALGLLSAARSASAQQAAEPRFGDAGQLVLSSDAQASLQVQSNSGTGSVTTLTLGPAADLFLFRSLSLGAHLLWQHQQISVSCSPGAAICTTPPSTDSVAVGLSVGYALRMSDAFSFWPKVSFDYRHTSTLTVADPTMPDQPNELSSDAMVIGVFAPVLFHPVPHFFIGLGPNFQAAVLSSASNDIDYGLMFTLGGWLNL
jgi:hypothetical protein